MERSLCGRFQLMVRIMTNKTISIAKDFSRYPAGRFLDDGPASGEQFRRDFLVDIMEGNQKVNIDLDGTRGYGSSFLEEAFGGLTRAGYTPEVIFNKINLVSEDASLIYEIESYIRDGNA